MTKEIQPAHAIYSPSACYRNLNCVGAIAVTKKAEALGLIKSSKYAEWGTDVHALCEKALRTMLSGQFFDFKTILDEEKHAVVWEYTRFINEVLTNFKKSHKGIEYHIEKKVVWDINFWGTCDFVLTGFHKETNAFEAVVVDLKTGKGVEVTAEDNEQLICYILCLSKELKKKFVRVHSFIFQPRTPGKEFTKWLIDLETMDRYAKQILANKKECVAHYETVTKGEIEFGTKCVAGEWCRFCPGKEFFGERPLCNAYAEDINSTALKVLDDVPEIPVVAKLTLQQKMEVFKRRKAMIAVIDDICKEVLKAGIAGEDLGDFKIVEGQSRRSLKKDDIEATAKKLRDLGVDQPLKTSLIGIGEIEKIIGKGSIPDELVNRSKPGYQVVPKDDKRPEIKQIGLESIEEIDLD